MTVIDLDAYLETFDDDGGCMTYAPEPTPEPIPDPMPVSDGKHPLNDFLA